VTKTEDMLFWDKRRRRDVAPQGEIPARADGPVEPAPQIREPLFQPKS